MRKKVVVTDSLFRMDGDFAPMTELVKLCKQHDFLLVIDDASTLELLGTQTVQKCFNFQACLVHTTVHIFFTLTFLVNSSYSLENQIIKSSVFQSVIIVLMNCPITPGGQLVLLIEFVYMKEKVALVTINFHIDIRY
ncbi:putative 8-amino-7-oxononanoate synthase [Rosa chinensis]|uniref:Putative 8-amino-7-oxononanoate synthase n=1 Tax=Rosa chinensis TaxID=74649 RepID=A0A2P6SFM9_ROSCH|nr:putative 8-amino-7-oxononanoate synthase [Rosa chinensis]